MSDLSEMKTWLRESDSTEWNGPYLVKVAEALERIEAELAESRRVNASLNKEHRDLAEKLSEAHNVAQALEDSAQEVRVKLAAANAKIEAARESDRIDLLLALGIESPKPTDNSESAT